MGLIDCCWWVHKHRAPPDPGISPSICTQTCNHHHHHHNRHHHRHQHHHHFHHHQHHPVPICTPTRLIVLPCLEKIILNKVTQLLLGPKWQQLSRALNWGELANFVGRTRPFVLTSSHATKWMLMLKLSYQGYLPHYRRHCFLSIHEFATLETVLYVFRIPILKT